MKSMNLATLISMARPDRDWLSLMLTALAVPFAVMGWQWIAVPLLVGSALASARSTPDPGRIQEVLELGGFGLPVFTLLRMVVLLLLGSQIWRNPDIAIPVVLAACLIALMMVPARLASRALASRLNPLVLSRNLPMSDVPAPSPIARAMASGLALAVPELIVTITASVSRDDPVIVWLAGASAVVVLGAIILLTALMIKRVGTPHRAAVLSAARRAISHLAPRVALYVGSNDAAGVYQVKMWLPTVEQVREPSIILMRSDEQFRELGPISTPVLCLPIATDFVALDLSSLRAGLYVANTGDIIHLIREPRVMSAFIGHGDSDKNSSFNPFTKVYDEIWLAGEAAARRYRRAAVGVREHQFVYVSRPQLDGIETAGPTGRSAGIPTILYAPTWEGWNAEQEYTSLLGPAVAFVKAVLSSDPPVRLIYKPHPYTGRRAPRAGAVHHEIVELLHKANQASGMSRQPSQRLPPAQRDAMRFMSAVAADELLAEYGRRFWKEVDHRSHVHVEGVDVGLYSCFNAADVLVTDVSSVISDFMASGKPFAVFNTGSTDSGTFTRSFPSTAAGLVISADGTGIDAVIDLANGRLPDIHQQARARMREDLLGPQSPSGTQRFVAAVTALVRRAEERDSERVQGRT